MNLRDLLATQSVPNIEFLEFRKCLEMCKLEIYFGGGRFSGQKAHITEAKRRGAICVLTDKSIPFGSDFSGVPVISMGDLATRRGMLASRFYSNPSGDLECVGITGTNGKTSIAYWIADQVRGSVLKQAILVLWGGALWENCSPRVLQHRMQSIFRKGCFTC